MVTTSRNVAKVYGKRHDHVVRDIELVISTIAQLSKEQSLDLSSGLFISSTYQPDPNGRSYPEYLLTRDGLALSYLWLHRRQGHVVQTSLHRAL